TTSSTCGVAWARPWKVSTPASMPTWATGTWTPARTRTAIMSIGRQPDDSYLDHRSESRLRPGCDQRRLRLEFTQARRRGDVRESRRPDKGHRHGGIPGDL